MILILNGGTNTVKAAIAEPAQGGVTVRERLTIEAEGSHGPAELFEEAIDRLAERLDHRRGSKLGGVDAVGHRVVHGGTAFSRPVWIDPEVESAIERLAPLAPLHNPIALAGVRAARARFPGIPMAAVFDTSFHSGRAPESMRYALPPDLTESLALYRFGFHGIAHASLVEGAALLEGFPPAELTAVTLQLGHGASACAVEKGRSVETSMGFTPLEGLVMGSRSGSVDPGVVLHLIRGGRAVEEVEDILARRSGLRGVAGSADMRTVLEAEAAGDPRAVLGVAMFVRRIVETVGAYFTLLEGRGALVFGGGIGENSPRIRSRVAAGLRAFGIELDPARNVASPPGRIFTPASRPVHVVRTDEETQIARVVSALLRRE